MRSCKARPIGIYEPPAVPRHPDLMPRSYNIWFFPVSIGGVRIKEGTKIYSPSTSGDVVLKTRRVVIAKRSNRQDVERNFRTSHLISAAIRNSNTNSPTCVVNNFVHISGKGIEAAICLTPEAHVNGTGSVSNNAVSRGDHFRVTEVSSYAINDSNSRSYPLIG